MTEKIKKTIESMTIDEMKQRLADYMAADQHLMSRIVAVEVRARNFDRAKCRYAVLLIAENGQENEVNFPDRYSRLIYIYTLLHPQGYQRYAASANNCKALRQLYSMLYFRDGAALMKTVESTDINHFFSHYIAQSRKAIRQTTSYASSYIIDRPQSHNGKVLIPFVAEGGKVILDSSLSSFTSPSSL